MKPILIPQSRKGPVQIRVMNHPASRGLLFKGILDVDLNDVQGQRSDFSGVYRITSEFRIFSDLCF